MKTTTTDTNNVGSRDESTKSCSPARAGGSQLTVEAEIERQMNLIASKNKNSLNSAQIVPLHPDWRFSTNGLYLLLATAGCGKSRFIIKHILMSEQLLNEPYYSQICYCSTSGELDKTISTYIHSKVIKTPLVEVPDTQLMAFLARHLKRKQKYYSMIEYIQSGFKTINKTLQHSIDKHNLKLRMKLKRRGESLPPDVMDTLPQYSSSTVLNNRIDTVQIVEKVSKPKLFAYIISKIQKYKYNRSVVPLLVILDDFAGHSLIENKRTPLAKMMTKCRHYSTTFIVAVQTAKYVIKDIRRQATDVVIWAGLNEEDFIQLFKEIQYSYNVDALWNEYRQLTNQKDHLILNCKAHSYTFIRVNVHFNDYAPPPQKVTVKPITMKI